MQAEKLHIKLCKDCTKLYKDCLGIMKEQCKNSRLPHLLMIVVNGETLWSPAPQPMDDDDDDDAS